jgi:FAD-linked oxidoreductase
MTQWRNWSGGVAASPRHIAYPNDETALCATVRGADGAVRAIGSGHSFSPVAACDGTLISLDRVSGIVGHDASAPSATVKAGTKIHALGRPLHDLGLGLKNQGDIDRQSIAGALSTGTHGTGRELPCLAAELRAFRLIAADGGAMTCSATENAEIFEAGRVSLGLFGVLSEVTLSLRKAYHLKEEGWTMSASDALRDLAQHRDGNRHFEFFWFPYSDMVVAKKLNETDEPAPAPLTPEQLAARGEAMSADQRAFQAGCEIARFIPAANPSLHKLFTQAAAGKPKVRWSHEIFPSPRNVRFNEMEYSVPAGKGADCARELVEIIRGQKIATAFPLEFRFIAKDDIWLSPFFGRDSVSISVHQYHKQPEAGLFGAAEAVFKRYDGRPHWGKMHTAGPRELAALYPRFEDFRSLRRKLDPRGKFLTPYLAAIMGETGHA